MSSKQEKRKTEKKEIIVLFLPERDKGKKTTFSLVFP